MNIEINTWSGQQANSLMMKSPKRFSNPDPKHPSASQSLDVITPSDTHHKTVGYLCTSRLITRTIVDQGRGVEFPHTNHIV